MSHLGDRVSSLVDGQLGIVAAERALSHIASCNECREAVEIERLLKHRLATLNLQDPGVDLVHRLLEMSGPGGPLPPRPGHVPGSPRPQLISTRVGFISDSGRGGDSGRGVGAGIRPPSRRGSSRPPVPGANRNNRVALGRVVRVTWSSRNRVAAAMVGAACLVGAGVAGGVANGAATSARVVPPVDTFISAHLDTTRELPFTDQKFSDQTVMWGTVGAGR
jgi:hypothetical protein